MIVAASVHGLEGLPRIVSCIVHFCSLVSPVLILARSCDYDEIFSKRTGGVPVPGVLHGFALGQVVHTHSVDNQLADGEHAVRQPCKVSTTENEGAVRTQLDNLVVVWEGSIDGQLHSKHLDVLDVVDVHLLRVFLVDVDLRERLQLLGAEVGEGRLLALLLLFCRLT